MRVMVGVVGLAGHALPAIALARELHERGHDVLLHSFSRWRETVEGLGIRFAGAERQIAELPSTEAAEPGVAELVRALLPSVREFQPDVVVSDGLTLTPALAAELCGLPRVTLLPEVYPFPARGLPIFSLGLRAPRTAAGSAAWRAAQPLLGARMPTTRWLRASRRELDRERARLGLGPAPGVDQPAVQGLTLVATLPQLEYPREWPRDVHVTGPMSFDPPHPPVRLPEGEEPLILVAPSTVKDPEGRLVRTALEAFADQPVRLVVTTGEAGPPQVRAPANALIAGWADHAQLMREASLVICHGNHGTVAKGLGAGLPLLVSPATPDDAEHGARVAWAGAGLMIPGPLLAARPLRAVAARLLADARFAKRARTIAAWSRTHDGPARGAELIERYLEAG